MAKVLVVSSSIYWYGEGFEKPKALLIEVDITDYDSQESLVSMLKREIFLQYPNLASSCSKKRKSNTLFVEIVHNFDSGDPRPKFIRSQLAYQLRQANIWLTDNKVRCENGR